MSGKRIINIESDPQTIQELCDYDQGRTTYISQRAMHGLDILTTPKIDGDNTATALGFIALVRRRHPSTGIPPEENPQDQVLVGTSRPFTGYSSIDGPFNHRPDGIYTLIPAA